jgi:hypothetical protein
VIVDVLLTNALNIVAQIAVRRRNPSDASQLVNAAARHLPALRPEQARLIARRLRTGTCLTRSMSLAARIPGAFVAIGVHPRAQTIDAHAWVEVGANPLLEDSWGQPMARLIGRQMC